MGCFRMAYKKRGTSFPSAYRGSGIPCGNTGKMKPTCKHVSINFTSLATIRNFPDFDMQAVKLTLFIWMCPQTPCVPDTKRFSVDGYFLIGKLDEWIRYYTYYAPFPASAVRAGTALHSACRKGSVTNIRKKFRYAVFSCGDGPAAAAAAALRPTNSRMARAAASGSSRKPICPEFSSHTTPASGCSATIRSAASTGI